jgi:hypothetical protein
MSRNCSSCLTQHTDNGDWGRVASEIIGWATFWAAEPLLNIDAVWLLRGVGECSGEK